MLDLIVAITLGVVIAMIAGKAGQVGTRPMAILPLLLVPAYMVPLFLMLHIVALMQGRRIAPGIPSYHGA